MQGARKFRYLVANYPGRTAGCIFAPGSLFMAASGINLPELYSTVTTFTLPSITLVDNGWMFGAGCLDMSANLALAIWADPKKQSDQDCVEAQDQKIRCRFLFPHKYPNEYAGAICGVVSAPFAVSAFSTGHPHELVMAGGALLGACLLQVRQSEPAISVSTGPRGLFNRLGSVGSDIRDWVHENPTRAAVSAFYCVNLAQIFGGLVTKDIPQALSGLWFAFGNAFYIHSQKRAQEIHPAP